MFDCRISGSVDNRVSTGLTLALLTVGLAGCGGGGGDAAEAIAQSFSIQSVSIAPSETNYPLNQPIRVTFNRALDFGSVTPNTFNVQVSAGEMVADPDNPGEFLAVGGLPAIGEYFLVDERTVQFQPACPTVDDLSNSGFLRGVEYTLNIPAQSTNGISLGAMGDGTGLDTSFTVTFRTADSTDPADLFLDTVVDPPAPVVRLAGSVNESATRLEIGGDSDNPVFLERTFFGGTGTPPMGFEAPLNFYSDPASRVDVLLVINQPVNPASTNVNNDRLRLEFMLSAGPDVWEDFPADVVLERNCSASGAEIRLIPLGPFPQDRPMRIVIEPEFEDLIGQRNGGALVDFSSFDTGVALNPGGMLAGDAADEVFEPFVIGGNVLGSLEDTDAAFEVPTADWAKEESSSLRPAFNFDGTGGPNGTFDLIIPGNVDTDFNSESQQFQGGPGGTPQETQVAINGVLNVRNLTISDGANWRVRGTRPITILASGSVRIDGLLSANGGAAAPIFTLNTANLPQDGAAGVGGGGNGGTGSQLTTQSTPQGGPGEGGILFVPGGGGGGGESGIATITSNNGENRRPGGGGGGVLGADTVLAGGCPNETYIGLNAETGHLGNATQAGGATGAISGIIPPAGGVTGPGPFSDPQDNNNFWGVLLTEPGTANQQVVRGELSQPWAGAGGGAGGDATNYSMAAGYPDPNFPLNREDKGCGGGGGAGGITILALGPITFGPNGRIEANGGTGGGGENTSFTNRVGGGSGGGSGGHIVLQSATLIDFSEITPSAGTCPTGGNAFNCLSIMALGGQGGAGAGNQGGFDPDWAGSGNPNSDAKPDVLDDMEMECTNTNPRPCTGGDGGPGLVQLHAPPMDLDPTLPNIMPPAGGHGGLNEIIRPSPIGFDDLADAWTGRMLPAFGQISRAQSKWIPLGAMRVAPGTSLPDVIQFLFDGIDPVTGFINTTGGIVDELPAVISDTLMVSGTFPYVDTDELTMIFDVTDLAGPNDLYRRNPNLLENFELQIDNGAVARFEVVHATTDEVAGELHVTVAAQEDGTNLGDFDIGDSVDLVPRFFAVNTEGISNFLPDSATISIRFQAAPTAINGGPDEALATVPTSDVNDLTTSPMNADFSFFRFIVEFDIGADLAPLSFSTPLPNLEFLRVPFRF